MLFVGTAFAGSFSAGMKKVCVYDCPDGYEYVVHTPGDNYSHTCADNSVMNNPSTTIDKKMEYDSTIGFSSDDVMKIVTGETPSASAQEKVNDDAIDYAVDWIYARDNAPAPVAPSVDDYKSMISAKLEEVSTLSDEMATVEGVTAADVAEVKAVVEEKSTSVITKIQSIDVSLEKVVTDSKLAGTFEAGE